MPLASISMRRRAEPAVQLESGAAGCGAGAEQLTCAQRERWEA